VNSDWSHMDYCLLKDAPKIAGVYFLMNGIELVYIGQSKNIRDRLSVHNSNWNCQLTLGNEKLEEDSFDSLYYFECDYKPERKEYEKMFIEDHTPKLNFDDWNRYYLEIIAKMERNHVVEG
jgi:excinuclease UvrABC nuclease subunit